MCAHATRDVHRAVLLEEVIAALQIDPSGTYVDATFGRGGHSRAVLAKLGPRGRLIAIDRDPQAIAVAQTLEDTRFSAIHARMSELAAVLAARAIAQVNGVLIDLGVSSPQLDDPARGFSFRSDGPLDMRMDPGTGVTAAQWLATASEAEIRGVIRDYGEERFAKQIAASIAAARERERIDTTHKLAALVGAAVRTREPGKDAATRTFQAVRIHVNRELEEVSLTLPQAIGALAPGGRLAVISFHSLEDRIVKRCFRAAGSLELPRDLPIRASEMPEPMINIVGRAIRPASDEVRANPRARSATLRVAQRTGAPFDRAVFHRTGPEAWRS